jgi:hypothetical protein
LKIPRRLERVSRLPKARQQVVVLVMLDGMLQQA